MHIKKILISGRSGMVGRNIIEHEKSADFQIYCPSHKELDLKDSKAVDNFVSQLRPDIIIHCAGTVGGIQDNISRPVDFLTDNLTIGMNLILAGRNADVKHFLNIGSSCMYPRNAKNPLKESAILTGELEPTNEGYAIAKIACARLCEYISRENPNLFYRTIIPCNLYGRHDKFNPQKSHMIPAVIRKTHAAILSGDKEIDIWGDGTARREFMYAGDLVDFIFYSFEIFHKLPQYLNVGLGYDHTINEYYNAVAEVIGYKGDYYHDLTKPTGMSQKLVDINELNKLGWKPKFSLKEGIKATFDYYLNEVKND